MNENRIDVIINVHFQTNTFQKDPQKIKRKGENEKRMKGNINVPLILFSVYLTALN